MDDGLNRNRQTALFRRIPPVVGFLVLGAGLYLGWTAFSEARGLLHDPKPLMRWLELRDHLHRDAASPKSERPLFKIEGRVSLFDEKQFKILGGYFTLFLGLLFVWILGKIAVIFIRAGAALILGEYRVKKRMEKDAEEK